MGLSIDKFLVILVIALVLLGPERLPIYAQKLGQLVKNIRRMSESAKDRLRDEMGEDFDEVDWKQLDPRQYDPRRIIRDALEEDRREVDAERRTQRQAQAIKSRQIASDGTATVASSGAAIAAAALAKSRTDGRTDFNFDDEAT
ncbi:MAG: twin-arginine translocase TatA/TatE family subunit [Canibacter sp.]